VFIAEYVWDWEGSFIVAASDDVEKLRRACQESHYNSKNFLKWTVVDDDDILLTSQVTDATRFTISKLTVL
jgi:hypothetical protein